MTHITWFVIAFGVIMSAGFIRQIGILCLIAAGLCPAAEAQQFRVASLGPSFVGERPQQLPVSPEMVSCGADSAYHLTLEDAKSRALSSSIVMELASQQVIAKIHALEAARKDYLPKLLNAFTYFHFDSDLGTVVTTPGIFNPATAITVPIIEQDPTFIRRLPFSRSRRC